MIEKADTSAELLPLAFAVAHDLFWQIVKLKPDKNFQALYGHSYRLIDHYHAKGYDPT